MSTNYIEILYDISMSIGQELDREKLLKKFLTVFCKKVNATSVSFFGERYHKEFSYPRSSSQTDGFIQEHKIAIMSKLKNSGNAQFAHEGAYFQVLKVNQQGIVVFCRTTNYLSDKFLKMLKPIQQKLSTSLTSCDQNKQLQKSVLEAQSANEAKSQFLANMSHEIRTPLNGILGTTEYLLSSPNEGELREKLEVIQQSGEFLLNVINEVLEISRIESGKVEIENINYSPKLLLNQLKKMFQVKATDKKLNLMLNVDKNIPELVSGDVHKIKQVLVNLLANALKFTPSGFVKLNAELSGDHSIVFSVQDSGVGIPQNKLDSIFKSFTQADISDSRKYGGSGLGLTISKNLAEIMNGELTVFSEETKGACFSLLVPLQEPSSDEVSMASDEAIIREFSINKPMSELKVLIVEDNLINQKVTGAFFSKMGVSYEIAENGQEAIDKIKLQSFDIIFMDCQMPVLDGFDATQQLREQNIFQGPIIALTANAFRATMEKCYAYGMDGFLTKPVSFEVLQENVKKLIV